MRASSFVINGKIYICGGQTYPNNGSSSNSTTTNLKSVEMFDPVLGTWTTRSPMRLTRVWATGSEHDDIGYVFGGYAHVSPTSEGVSGGVTATC